MSAGMGWVVGGVWLALIVFGIVLVGTSTRDPDGKAGGFQPWLLALTILWTLGVIVVAGATHTIDSWALCSTASETTAEAVEVEEVVTDVDAVSAEQTDSTVVTTTRSPGSRTTTTSCDGLSIGQVALLLVPGLLFLVPMLTGIDIAGLFKLSFREVKDKLDEQEKKVDAVREDIAAIKVSQETIVKLGVNVSVVNEFGARLARGLEQADPAATLAEDQVLG